MNSMELIRPRRNRERPIVETGIVYVFYGGHSLEIEIAGLSVAEARLALRDILSVGDGAGTFVNQNRVSCEDVILRPGDTLVFMRWRGRKGSGETEFFSMTYKEAAALFGVSVETIRRWILSGRLAGTRNPLRTNLTACRDLRDKQRVQQQLPAESVRSRNYSRTGRAPWQFIDPDKSSQN